ncbi:MliC family protein [[Pseudomonas] carboxydohydrogena]|uniref:MliC family protein n=1 Tax=Afipia carboxydohydrogena TaxID=290 RepID=A0ABY8BS88_AFICR|nr:MliC family protein [[Pseudomonas] carboxydohydrogena]WEF52868.1 MliC family protein [[Pseudomonas] carboxydohydrogena]
MKPALACAIVPVFCFALGGTLAHAQSAEASPAGFDCAKANTRIEKIVCGNPTLAMLDRETTRVLTLTREDASVSQPNILKDQDNWLKQRNECLSSTDRERCLADSYVGRISALRADSPTARAAKAGISLGPFNAECDNGNASLTVVFVNSKPSYAYVAGRKDAIVLKQALSGSGARYEAQYPKGQARLWNKGNAAQIALPGGRDMSCTMTPAGK